MLVLGAGGQWQQRQQRKMDELKTWFGFAVGLSMGSKGKKIKLDFQGFWICFALT